MNIEELIYLNKFEEIINLVKMGSDINATDRDGRTSLMMTVVHKEEKYFSEFINLGANIDIQDKKGWTALHFAVQFGCLDFIKILIAKNAKIDPQDSYGNSPMIRAILSSPKNLVKEIINYLLDNGANPDLKNKTGISARSVASTITDLKTIFDGR